MFKKKNAEEQAKSELQKGLLADAIEYKRVSAQCKDLETRKKVLSEKIKQQVGPNNKVIVDGVSISVSDRSRQDFQWQMFKDAIGEDRWAKLNGDAYFNTAVWDQVTITVPKNKK